MKYTALQLTRQYIYDNEQYIEGNIAEHLISNMQNAENGYLGYLTDEEILEYEDANMDRKAEIETEIEAWINDNFDYDVSEFEYL